MNDALLLLIEKELGTVQMWEQECPGVLYFSVQPDDDTKYCLEYFVVFEQTSLSQDALALGKTLDGTSYLLYPINPPTEGAWTAVMYEICKYRLAHGIQGSDGWSLTSAAAEGMELCPSYFGSFPVPPHTPWGWTLRHKILDNGIYWMETGQGKTVLAVCEPIWTSELPEIVKQAGKTLSCTGADNDEESLHYLFFDNDTSCAALFELLNLRPEWLTNGLIRKPELMNAIWQYCPMYAAAYNAGEQVGLHDGLGSLLQMLVEAGESRALPENMISLTPTAGTDFIGFWK